MRPPVVSPRQSSVSLSLPAFAGSLTGSARLPANKEHPPRQSFELRVRALGAQTALENAWVVSPPVTMSHSFFPL
jgi:hypothetical protein